MVGQSIKKGMARKSDETAQEKPAWKLAAKKEKHAARAQKKLIQKVVIEESRKLDAALGTNELIGQSRAHETNLYLHRHLLLILQDNWISQCLFGHSCKHKTKEELACTIQSLPRRSKVYESLRKTKRKKEIWHTSSNSTSYLVSY